MRPHHPLTVVGIALAAIVVGWVILPPQRPDEPPARETLLDRAHRLCSDCDLFAPEIDHLIEDTRATGHRLTREEQYTLFLGTFAKEDRPAAGELCGPCAQALFDVARGEQ